MEGLAKGLSLFLFHKGDLLFQNIQTGDGDFLFLFGEELGHDVVHTRYVAV